LEIEGEPVGHINVDHHAFDSDSEAEREVVLIESDVDEMPVIA
jgi:hypothetical protein